MNKSASALRLPFLIKKTPQMIKPSRKLLTSKHHLKLIFIIIFNSYQHEALDELTNISQYIRIKLLAEPHYPDR